MIETQRLFGLVVSDNKKIELKKIDRPLARRLLIEKGLIEGNIGRPLDFLARNLRLIDEVKELEERTRRRDLLANREKILEFYDRRLPAYVMCRKSLMNWLKVSTDSNNLLLMTEKDASALDLSSVPFYLFPPFLDLEGTKCPINYKFAPGELKDGMTVSVPAALVTNLRESFFDKLVPGLLSEKVESLLRSLPKNRRRIISPIREYALAALESVRESPKTLDESLANALTSIVGMEFSPKEFRNLAIDRHLHCYLEIVDCSGQVILEGRTSEVLHRLPDIAPLKFLEGDAKFPISASWQFGQLPERSLEKYGAFQIAVYPSLVCVPEGITIRQFTGRDRAHAEHRKALEKLLVLGCAQEIRRAKRFEKDGKLALLAAFFRFPESLTVLLVRALASLHSVCAKDIRNKEAFQVLLHDFKKDLMMTTRKMLETSEGLLEEAKHLHDRIECEVEAIPPLSLKDLQTQLRELMDVRLVDAIARKQSSKYKRYLSGITIRLDRIRGNPGKDGEKLKRYLLQRDRFQKLALEKGLSLENVRYVQSIFEEWRIALFAPELGTSMKINSERIKEVLSNL